MRFTSIVHILSPETDNCPSWISGRERMTVENISWSISMKECWQESVTEFLVFLPVTLEIRPKSRKSEQFFVMSKFYFHENLVRMQLLLQKILCRQESVTPLPAPLGSTWKITCPPLRRWGYINIDLTSLLSRVKVRVNCNPNSLLMEAWQTD